MWLKLLKARQNAVIASEKELDTADECIGRIGWNLL
jgi:hypothetical protein